MVNKPKKKIAKKKRRIFPLIFIFIILAIAGVMVGVYLKSEYNEIKKIKHEIAIESADADNNEQLDTEFLKAIVPDADSGVKVINISESSELPDCEYDTVAGNHIRRVYSGRRINIAVTGVDSRLGSRFKHADANHIISILLDSGRIEIISIPRDTYADAGFDDTTGQNKLTVVRASRGKKTYFKELCRIGGVDKIHYYAEIGFSQAIGIIEWLGFNKPNETLRILRSRSALGGDDFQRVYNQGQFIRQMLFKNFSRLDGVMGDIFIGSGLLFVDSDLTTAKVREIMNILKQKNFQNSIENIRLKVRPSFPAKFKVYDFADAGTVNSLSEQVKKYYQRIEPEESAESGKAATDIVYYRLSKVLDRAKADSAKSPQKVITNIGPFFEQRAWLQILEKEKRQFIRDGLIDMMANAYEKKKDTISADKIRRVRQAEDNLLNINKNPVHATQRQ